MFFYNYSQAAVVNKSLIITENSQLQKTLPEIEQTLYQLLPKLVLQELEDNPIILILDSSLTTDGFFYNQTPSRVYLHPKLLDNPGLSEVTLHEIFHAVQFRYHPQEENWVKEGLAQIFSYLGTKHLSGYGVENALKKPGIQLFAQYDHLNLNAAWYGKTLLFAKFFLNHCSNGDELSLFQKWAGFLDQPNSYGLYWINSILKNNLNPKTPDYCKNSKNLFIQFALAFAINKANDQRDNPYYIFSTSMKAKAEETAQELLPWSFQIIKRNAFIEALKTWQIDKNKILLYELNDHFPYVPKQITDPTEYLPQNNILAIRTQ